MNARQDEFALITGASSGIGECFARSLAERGRNLVLVARSKDKLAALAGSLMAKHGIRAEVGGIDLSQTGAAARLADELRSQSLAIDLLVNNAGFGARGEFWKLALERQAEMLRPNLQTLVELTWLLLPSMVEKRRGGVINVSSTAGFQPVPFSSVYAASKAFVTNFSLALAEEVQPYGVAVVTLCPGGTRTNFFEASQYGKRTMPGGLQAPEEVVRAGLKALDRGGGLVIPRWVNKASVFAQRFVPRSWPTIVASRIFRL